MVVRDLEDVQKELVGDLELFDREVQEVYSTLVLPHWDGEFHRFRHTLYGYMMVCFAYVDLFSAYWRGDGSTKDQTKRMIDFMDKYMSVDREACNVAVHMWRHKLMHTGRPRFLRSETTGTLYRWLLHWWEHLPAGQHFTFSETTDHKTLNIGLIYLIRDLRAAVKRYLADLSRHADLQSNFERVESELQSGKFKPY